MKKERIIELEKQASSPAFWENQKQAQEITHQLSDFRDEVNTWESLSRDVVGTLEIAQDLEKEQDEELERDVIKKTEELLNNFERLEFTVFFQGKFSAKGRPASGWDEHGAIVSISAGAGGTDAQDWAEMLERMLLRYCERKEFKTRILDRQQGAEAGIKSSTFEVSGKYAYAWLKSESGVHRLVRISPFDADKSRHTSFALVDIIPDLGDVKGIEIKDEDLRVDVFRASGHGGQSVNTTDSAVRIVHEPSKIVVTCQNERSQQQNKQTAMKILRSRLAQKQEQERDAQERRIRGDVKSAEWGSQIRSYVIHPYKMVKDHRTNLETSDVDAILRGELDKFSEFYIKWIFKQK